MGIFFGVECFHFPRELKKEFQQIDSSNAAVDKHNFLRMCAIACEKAVLNRVEKYIVYF